MQKRTGLDYGSSEPMGSSKHGEARVFQAHGPREVTVIVPAYKEAASISDTLKSLLDQTHRPTEIIVVDDFSTDRTFEVARTHGVTVVRPPKNTGSKAGAQTFALPRVRTDFTMAIDADTILAPDAIAKLLTAFDDSKVQAASGFVLPRFIRTVWERGRYIEYLFAFTFYKQLQNYFGKPLISSGCFSIYRTEALRENGGWSNRTMAEDMDLTWSFYARRHGVAFVPEAVCYPIEPENFAFMRKQLRRWSHGFIQNVSLHWKHLLDVPFLREVVAVSLWDAVVASFVYLFVLPAAALYAREPLFLIGYVIDAPIIFLPVLVASVRRKEFLRAVASFPAFYVLRVVNGLYILEAVVTELLLRRRLTVYEKGH